MAIQDRLQGKSSQKKYPRADKRGPQEIHSEAKTKYLSTPVQQLVHCTHHPPPTSLSLFFFFQVEGFIVVILFPPHKCMLQLL